MFEWTDEWVDRLERTSGIRCRDRDNIEEIATALRELNRIFTGRQEMSGNPYGRQQRFRKAYALYYLMANFPKIMHVLTVHKIDHRAISRLVDLGTGPGTIPLSVIALRASDRVLDSELDITCLDHSKDFLDFAGYMIRNWRREFNLMGKTRLVCGDVLDLKLIPSETADLLSIGNMMTEISSTSIVSRIVRIATKLVADGKWFLMLEPASPKASRTLLRVREELVVQGWHVEGPCPGSYSCPALSSPEDWCHHRLAWNRPAIVTELDEVTGFNKQFLNFSYCLLRKGGGRVVSEPIAGNVFIVVSDLLASKGKYEVYLCGLGRKVLVKLDKKHMSDENRDLIQSQRYDRVMLDGYDNLDDRIDLMPTSRFFRLNNSMEGQ